MNEKSTICGGYILDCAPYPCWTIGCTGGANAFCCPYCCCCCWYAATLAASYPGGNWCAGSTDITSGSLSSSMTTACSLFAAAAASALLAKHWIFLFEFLTIPIKNLLNIGEHWTWMRKNNLVRARGLGYPLFRLLIGEWKRLIVTHNFCGEERCHGYIIIVPLNSTAGKLKFNLNETATFIIHKRAF